MLQELRAAKHAADRSEEMLKQVNISPAVLMLTIVLLEGKCS